MEVAVHIHVELLQEGVFLATSEQMPGLVAQGRTVAETLEIARDVAKKFIEMQGGNPDDLLFPPAKDSFDYPLIVNT